MSDWEADIKQVSLENTGFSHQKGELALLGCGTALRNADAAHHKKKENEFQSSTEKILWGIPLNGVLLWFLPGPPVPSKFQFLHNLNCITENPFQKAFIQQACLKRAPLAKVLPSNPKLWPGETRTRVSSGYFLHTDIIKTHEKTSVSWLFCCMWRLRIRRARLLLFLSWWFTILDASL